MGLINKKDKWLFIHIPKNAGTSFRRALISNKDVELLRPRHRTANEILTKFGPTQYKQYYKFAFVRNPWDRCVSLYHYSIAQCDERLNETVRQSNPYQYKIYDVCKRELLTLGFEDWLLQRHDFPDKIQRITDWKYKPQSTWVMKDGKRIVNYIGKVEEIKDVIFDLKPKIGRIKKLEKVNATKHRHYSEYYTFKSIAWVAKTFESDIRNFDYRFEHPDIV